ncbi:hypothetical protein CSA08_01380 [Candidatus Gracilibacteria bacterium]|nr:MAG: hypothetical protein CSA08_01380 [Candidatus Gracilibacteria bacterium]
MEPTNFDINFLKKGKFTSNEIKNLVLYFIDNYVKLRVEFIKGHNYDSFTFDFIENGDYEVEDIVLNKDNFYDIIEKNIIRDIYVDINNFCKLHIYIGFLDHEIDINISKISFYYDLKMGYEDIFYYLGDNIFKSIEVLNPDNANFGLSTSPVLLSEIKKGVTIGEYLFLNNAHIKYESLRNCLHQLDGIKLRNGYIFYVNDNEDLISQIVNIKD